MNPITLVMAHYCNQGMLQHQYKRISELPAEIKGSIYLVLVDDGSPEGKEAIPPEQDLGICSLQIYKMLQDIRWNQDACRNIGVRHAETEWVLLADMDHVIPPETWRVLLGRDWHEDAVYCFRERLKMPNLEPDKPHPNTWFMTRKTYNKFGGYDERFAGIYGTDGDFKKRASAVTEIKEIKNAPLVVYPRSVIPDASTTTYLRKQPEDDVGKRRVKSERELDEDKSPKNFLFPYKRVYP